MNSAKAGWRSLEVLTSCTSPFKKPISPHKLAGEMEEIVSFFPRFPIPEEASFCLKTALHFLPLQLQSSGGQQGGLLALFLPQHRTWTRRPWAGEGPSEQRCPAKANTGFRRILSFFFSLKNENFLLD